MWVCMCVRVFFLNRVIFFRSLLERLKTVSWTYWKRRRKEIVTPKTRMEWRRRYGRRSRDTWKRSEWSSEEGKYTTWHRRRRRRRRRSSVFQYLQRKHVSLYNDTRESVTSENPRLIGLPGHSRCTAYRALLYTRGDRFQRDTDNSDNNT